MTVRAPILFDDFQPGASLGMLSEAIGEETIADWMALYPWDRPRDGLLPPGFSTVLLMRAYLALVTPRPPGNIQIGKSMWLIDRIRIGETVTTAIGCAGKELKGQRRVVRLSASGSGDNGRPLFEGVLTLFWSA